MTPAMKTDASARGRLPPAVRRLLAGGLAVCALGAAVFLAYRTVPVIAPYISSDNAYVKGDLTFVTTKVAGYVAGIETEDGQTVAAGQILVRIDPRDLESAARDAEANVARQRAAELQLQAQSELQGAQIEVADAGVVAAEALIRKTAADLARATTLRESGAVSVAYYDQALADDLKARASLTQAEAQARLARRQLLVIAAQSDGATADQQGAQARLDRARNDADAAVIRAPREGVAVARNVRVGEYVGVGQRLLAIAPTQGLWVQANLRETQLGRLRPGDRVAVSIDALPGRTLCGRVDGLPGASGAELALLPPDNATGNFTKIVRRFSVRILLDPGQPASERLAAGMSVQVRIALGSHGGGRTTGLACARN
jgi:membrane fusion protein (multidrug efflux system)